MCKINLTIFIITFIQIMLLMNFVAANSYLIHKNESNIRDSPIINSNDKLKERINSLVESGTNLLIGFLTIKQIGIVSAQALGCCNQTTYGAICQDVIQGSGTCTGEILPSLCEDVSYCETGCCIDDVEGLCSEGSPRLSCENSGGTWDRDSSCNIRQCQNGCCVLGSNTQFVNENRCQYLSDFYGLPTDFRQQIRSEVECLFIAENQTRGACMMTGEACEINTRPECMSNGGDFYENLLCSNPSLNTICEKQKDVGCVEDKDEIYWFDSCGNRENIYGSDKNASWNNGIILPKSLSCNPSSGNINSETCGNCNYLLGSKCGETDGGETHIREGDFVCKDLNCYNTFDGTSRVNGESWCTFDGAVGQGKDPVGSRHWKHMCIDGKEVVDPCSDFRQEVCVEQEVEVNNNQKISVAQCHLNEWRTCYEISNTKNTAEMKKKCNENKHCFVKDVWHPGTKVADEPVSVCLPQYPPGFQFYGSGAESANSLCGAASVDIEIVKVKDCGFLGIGKHWVYVANKVAKEEAWTQSMNKWCTSLGDCGAYINYAGDVTTGGYGVKGKAPRLSQGYLNELKEFKVPNPDALVEISGTDNSPDDQNGQQGGGLMGIIGMGGSALMLAMNWDKVSALFLEGLETLGIENLASNAAFRAFGAAGLAFMAGRIIANLLGLDPDSANQVGAVGAITAAGLSVGFGSITIAAGTVLTASSLGAVGATTVLTSGVVNLASGVQVTASVEAPITLTSTTTSQGLLIDVAGGTLPEGVTMSTTSVTTQAPATTAPALSFGTILIIAIIVIIIIAIIMKLLGCGKQVKEPAGFQCRAWEPPSGGENCHLCNEDSLHPCSEYRCKSLGAACEFIDADTSEPKCIWQDPNDVSPPVMTPWQESLTQGYEYDNINSCPSDCSHEITNTQADSGCLEAYKVLDWGITTDDYAKCKFDFENKEYDDMENILSGLFMQNHTTQVSSPGVLTLQQELARLIASYRGEDLEDGGDFFESLLNQSIDKELDIYVKCKDPNGNTNLAPLAIKMCLDPEPDLTAPRIVSASPRNKGYVKYGENIVNVSIYTNEPADCKYSQTDKEYDLMENDFTCFNELSQGSVNGWQCITTLTNIENATTNYIRCKDNPFALENETRNVNSESLNYTIYKSTSELKIDSIIPNGTRSYGSEPITFDMEVFTSGGANNGISTCSYQWGDSWILFRETNSYTHVQKKLNLNKGHYVIPISCVDEAGNVAYKNSSFALEIDSSPPKVVRAYKEGNRLNLITDEEAECYYTHNTCYFDVNSDVAVSMTTALSTYHSTEWTQGITYHVKCADSWGNRPDGCSIKVLPSAF